MSLDLTRYVNREGIIEIPYRDLRSFNDRDVVNSISKLISNGVITYPVITTFQNLKVEDIPRGRTGSFFDIVPYIERLPSFLSKETRKYNGKEVALLFDDRDYNTLDVLSSFFTEDVRIRCNVKNFAPPIVAWRSKAKEIASRAYDVAMRDRRDFNMGSLDIGLYQSNIKLCTTFKISVAMAIYNGFRPRKVYDFSSGWGDRAIAAALSNSVNVYVGTDPNHDLVDGHEKLKRKFESVSTTKLYLYNHPAESIDLEQIFGPAGGSGGPDLIFTSPPFFDYEIYNKDEKQSIHGKADFNDWYENWLLPVTIKAWDHLKMNGHLVYHLGYLNDKDSMSDRLIESLSLIPGVKFKGQIPIIDRKDLNKRPMFIYVWQKVPLV